ncbi:hypothetical protein NCC49_005699 [Naganishia albida]|nr:hypothetical protein NCC49_005699 [Naganishia albida]
MSRPTAPRQPSVRPPTAVTGPYQPPGDTATYRDLLLFEERLKMNASMLARRRGRYEAFLVVLILTIIFLANKILFQPPQLAHVRYLAQGFLAVALVTLVLFFASGMYQERIGYANKYVPHANKSLRSLNMHLNMRRAPKSLRSFLLWIPILGVSPTAVVPLRRNGASNPTTPATTTALIPPIPPTTNPRGELIFSSRVDKTFKEGYERYRAAFERRRAEKLREVRWERRWGWTRRVVGVFRTTVVGEVPPPPSTTTQTAGQRPVRRRVGPRTESESQCSR